jgi:RsiW-degrading membrane proteinase PrsW (M82 family)
MVFLFFELNILKNVSLLQVLMLMCVGGVLSIGISLAADSMSDLGWMGASAAGIVEETGKILAVFLILKKKPQNYILNGLLLGAAVGAGFAALESAGYIYLWRGDSTPAEFADIITIRAIGNLFGHIVWTAIAGAALLRAKGNREVRANLLLDPKFLTALSIPITLHMLWNSPLPNLFQLKTVVLGLVGWYVVFGMVQQGLTQVRLSKHALQSRHAMPV